MIKIFGALLFSLAAYFWGRERGRSEEEKILILEALIFFVDYTQEEITNFKTPLFRIYSDFDNPILQKIGFISLLRNEGVEKATEVLCGKISESAYKDVKVFAKGLGGGYSEGQKKLCEITQKRLEKVLKDQKSSLAERVRMYRLLPVLIAASVIILLI